MTRLLLMHTCGQVGSVALGEDGEVIAEQVLPALTSSEALVPAIRRLLTERDWSVGSLAAVVVINGPGSFTGVRVGLSAAKGLCEAGQVPMIAISRLALLAEGDERTGTTYPVLDAGRGEFYLGEYAGRACIREALVGREELAGLRSSGMLVTCEEKVAATLQGWTLRKTEEPRAGMALRLALERLGAGDMDDIETVDANYLRRTDAETQAQPIAATKTSGDQVILQDWVDAPRIERR